MIAKCHFLEAFPKKRDHSALLRLIIVASTVLTLASCKLRLVVPEGGSVETNSMAFSCASGKICTIDVVDIFFDETFVATAADGHQFTQWRKRDRGFCGGNSHPCHLFTSVFEGYDILMSVLESDEILYLEPVFEPSENVVVLEDKIWFQPDLFTGLTWNEIDAICPENQGGKCKNGGTLNGIDVTGWRWASIDDIITMFNSYIGFDALGLGNVQHITTDSRWAPRFYEDGWRANWNDSGTYGWTRSTWLEDADFAVTPFFNLCPIPNSEHDYCTSDSADVAGTALKSKPHVVEVGAWFYINR